MRKFNHKKILSISSKQIECIERQYWLRYNNNVLESMLNHKINTNTAR
jgi:hypothetical protein